MELKRKTPTPNLNRAKGSELIKPEIFLLESQNDKQKYDRAFKLKLGVGKK